MPSAYGLRPIRHYTGGTIRADEATITSGYASNIRAGDPVKRVADGSIERAAAGDVIFGVFDQVNYVDELTGKIEFSGVWPAGRAAKEIKAFVYSDPYIVYKVMDDAEGRFLTQADVGASGDIIITEGPNNIAAQYSGVMLDSSTVSATASQLKIMQKTDRVGNKWATANGQQVELEVMINEQFVRQTAGV